MRFWASHTSSPASLVSSPKRGNGDSHQCDPRSSCLLSKPSFINQLCRVLGGPDWSPSCCAHLYRMFLVLGSSTSRVTAEMGGRQTHPRTRPAAEPLQIAPRRYCSPLEALNKAIGTPSVSEPAMWPKRKRQSLKREHSGEQMQIDQAVEFLLEDVLVDKARREGCQPLNWCVWDTLGPN